MSKLDHWQSIYSNHSNVKHGWFAPHLNTSLSWIHSLNLALENPIIDVGAGSSTLVDDLLEQGHNDLTMLDLSDAALSSVKKRLAQQADNVNWIQGDITTIDLPSAHYYVWHDRAVFHFLIEKSQQLAYKDQLLRALKPCGYFILGTFSLDGPAQCSGLPVQRYSLEDLQNLFGNELKVKQYTREIHTTPSAVKQSYLYCLFQKSC